MPKLSNQFHFASLKFKNLPTSIYKKVLINAKVQAYDNYYTNSIQII